ncbi:MAG: 5'-nucleotidase C-terminal domain-containing protein [Bacteroidota bacterium]|jgi:2',3'-cyclic-nucleotide 2'-phosphodiesterase (5'-nucleotidase family)
MSPKSQSVVFITILLVCCSCAQKFIPTESQGRYLEIKGSTYNSPDLNALIKPYKDSVSRNMDRVIGSSLVAMEKGKPESILGNFVSDVCLDRMNKELERSGQPQLDFFIFNLGGLRGVIPKGDVKLWDIYQLMPFDNELAWVELPYDSLQSLFQYIGSRGGIPVSGFKCRISEQSCVDVTFKDGSQPTPGKTYRVGTNDFLARGGDGMIMLGVASGINSIGIKVRDALIEHFKLANENSRSVNSELDGRIHIK